MGGLCVAPVARNCCYTCLRPPGTENGVACLRHAPPLWRVFPQVSGGNGEQVMSRDVHRLCTQFDFFRLLSFYHSGCGFFMNSFLVMLSVYVNIWVILLMALVCDPGYMAYYRWGQGRGCRAWCGARRAEGRKEMHDAPRAAASGVDASSACSPRGTSAPPATLTCTGAHIPFP